eukprot:7916101-Karenia_brevis.AAC.1
MEKIKARREYGIFVGVNRRSNEFLIADEKGIRKARPIRRIPKEKLGEIRMRIEKYQKELLVKRGKERMRDLKNQRKLEERKKR